MASNQKIWLPPEVQKRIEQQKKKNWAGFESKTLWDWLQLLAVLAIPVAVAFGTFWFTAAQNQASDKASTQQHDTDLHIATDQQQETALQNYLDKMTDLLLNNNLKTSKTGDIVREVARTRTLTLLPQLNGTRKGAVIQFLFEAGLIYDTIDYNDTQDDINPIVSLTGANRSGVYLHNVTLSTMYAWPKEPPQLIPPLYIDLSGADLNGADLSSSDLRGANLSETDLSNANLRNTDFQEGYMVECCSSAPHYLAPTNLYGANLTGAYLSSADLEQAYLYDAILNRANLNKTNLLGANLTGADLSYANLTEAASFEEQLNKVASLKDAIMPDGSIHP